MYIHTQYESQYTAYCVHTIPRSRASMTAIHLLENNLQINNQTRNIVIMTDVLGVCLMSSFDSDYRIPSSVCVFV